MDIPIAAYVIVGTWALANLGLIITMVVGYTKMTFFLGRLMTRFEVAEKNIDKEIGARDMAVRAHRRVDQAETRVNNLEA